MGKGALCRLRKILGTVILLTSLGFIVAACGGETASEEDDSWETTPQTTEDEYQEVWAALPPFPPAPREAENPRLRGSQELSHEEFLQFVANDANAKWQADLETAGIAYAPLGFVTYDRGIITSCASERGQTQGPLYCDNDQTIYFPLNWQKEGSQQTTAEEFGDFAMATVVAHEVGHHVQMQFRLPDLVRRGYYTVTQRELQADCYAGVWGYSVYRQGLVEAGDIEEAMNISWHSGDPSQMPAGYPMAHGSSEERVQAFMTGYDYGDPVRCIDEYTPLPQDGAQ